MNSIWRAHSCRRIGCHRPSECQHALYLLRLQERMGMYDEARIAAGLPALEAPQPAGPLPSPAPEKDEP